MKILSKKEFLTLPNPVVYCDYEDYSFNEIGIKTSNCNSHDFFYLSIPDVLSSGSNEMMDILDRCEKTKESFELDFDCVCRDGMFEESQLYAVFEQKEIDEFINLLKTCKGI